MSITEKANHYSLTLPRFAFLHIDYLNTFMQNPTTAPIRQFVTKHTNCEDIAMSFWISSQTNGQPPMLADLWAMKSMIKLYAQKRISGQGNHKILRDECVDTFSQILGLKNRLVAAEYIHRENEHPQFACGAIGTSLLQNEHSSPRQRHHQDLMRKWKKLSSSELLHELQRRRAAAAEQAYRAGFIEKSEPWKKRWGK